MNDNAKKWVAELRSGKYEQGKHVLNDNGKFCCLGVACELAVEAGILPPPRVDEKGIGWYMTQFRGKDSYDECTYLPPQVTLWLGLRHNLGTDGNGLSLPNLNDSGMSFEGIAYIIEQTPGLFQTEEEEG